MTWAKLDDHITDQPAMLALPRGIRLLHIEGIVWCCRHETDGAIAAHVLGKLTDEPDATQAADRLVEAGLWETTDDGWEVVGFLDNQRSAEDIARARELTNHRQRRRRQHLAGDHSLCDPRYCKAASRVTNGVTDGVSHASPSRPDPSRPDRKGGGTGKGGGTAGSADADPPDRTPRERLDQLVRNVITGNVDEDLEDQTLHDILATDPNRMKHMRAKLNDLTGILLMAPDVDTDDPAAWTAAEYGQKLAEVSEELQAVYGLVLTPDDVEHTLDRAGRPASIRAALEGWHAEIRRGSCATCAGDGRIMAEETQDNRTLHVVQTCPDCSADHEGTP